MITEIKPINEMTSEDFNSLCSSYGKTYAHDFVAAHCTYEHVMEYGDWKNYFEMEEEYGGHHYNGLSYEEYLVKCIKNENINAKNAVWLKDAYERLMTIPYGDEWEATLEMYSDVYKDVHGYRPRAEIKVVVETRNLGDARNEWFKKLCAERYGQN